MMKAVKSVGRPPPSEDEIARRAIASAAPLSTVQVIHSRTGILMQISEGDNKVEMRHHADGQLTILVNQQRYSFSAADAPTVTVDSGTNPVAIIED